MSDPCPLPPHDNLRRGDSCVMKEAVSEVVAQLVEDYRTNTAINHLDGTELPSREAVAEILSLCRQVLFPGYFVKQDLCEATVGYFAGQRLDELFGVLSAQIARARMHQLDPKARAETCERGVWQEADATALSFLRALPRLRALLRDDVEAAFDGDPAAKGFDEIILSYPGLEAVTTYRVGHELHTLGVPLIPRMMTELAHGRTGIDIHPGAEIGRRFFIDHGTGVVIGETAVIGANVKLYQGVTLGALSFPKDASGQLIRGQKRHPTIEDNVVIYAGATILGGETVIGRGSVIGGGVWLTRPVPPFTKVLMGDPQLVVKTREEQRPTGQTAEKS